MALVTFCPDATPGYRNGTRTRCVVQPARRKYLPAGLSLGRTSPLRSAVPSVLSIPLADGEAEALFAPGQRFTIWADVMVGHTIRGEGLLGYGVIVATTANSRGDASDPYTGTEATPA